jgi:hypothetical protein
MPRLTTDQWAAIRIEWEGEPTATFSALADKYGVDKAQVGRVAKRDGWSKTGQLASINEAAQRKADARCNSEGNSTQHQLNQKEIATRDESIDVRAEVLERHRREWAELESYRQDALQAMKDAKGIGDKEAWTIAKLAADATKQNLSALEVKQSGERRAWGLEQQAEAEIVISNPRSVD